MKKDRMELYKAVKYQVQEFQADCGMNVMEMWKMVNGTDEQSMFWKRECLADYANR